MILFSLFFPSHFPDSSVGEESSCNAGHPDDSCVGKIPWRRDRPLQYSWASLVAQLVKNLPAMRETRVWSLGWEDPPEKGKATHASILAWRNPGTTQSMGSQKVRHDWVTFTSLSIPLLHSTRLSKCTNFPFSFYCFKMYIFFFFYIAGFQGGCSLLYTVISKVM